MHTHTYIHKYARRHTYFQTRKNDCHFKYEINFLKNQVAEFTVY